MAAGYIPAATLLSSDYQSSSVELSNKAHRHTGRRADPAAQPHGRCNQQVPSLSPLCAQREPSGFPLIFFYSHSMVPGGLLVMSKTTRLTPLTSFTIRLLMRASTSYGTRAQSAVMASSLVTTRTATTLAYVR